MTWRELRDFVRIEMVAGPPETLTLPGWDPEEVSSDHSLKLCYSAQICFVPFKTIYMYAVLNETFAMLKNRPKDCQRDEMYERKHCDN